LKLFLLRISNPTFYPPVESIIQAPFNKTNIDPKGTPHDRHVGWSGRLGSTEGGIAWNTSNGAAALIRTATPSGS